MTTTSSRRSEPFCGEIWTVAFDPSVGSEIRKTRPAVVVSADSLGRYSVRIVVPFTSAGGRERTEPWFVPIFASDMNGLHQDCYADSLQVKSISIERFIQPVGVLRMDDFGRVLQGVASCIDWEYGG